MSDNLPYHYLRLGWPTEKGLMLVLIENSLCLSSNDSTPMCKVINEELFDTMAIDHETGKKHLTELIIDGWITPVVKQYRGKPDEVGFLWNHKWVEPEND